MINSPVSALHTEADGVIPVLPAHVETVHILIVSEQEGITCIGVAHVGESSYEESRDSAFKKRIAVGAGDTKRGKPNVGVEVDVECVKPLACISKISVEE